MDKTVLQQTVAYLSRDPFEFLDKVKTPYIGVSNHKAKYPMRLAKMHSWLDQIMPIIAAGRLEPTVLNAISMIIDNETGERTIRENGFGLTPKSRVKLIKDTAYLGKAGNPVGNAVAPHLSKITMEDDCIKFRGFGWIQLTGRSNFEASGDTAYAIRRKLPPLDANQKYIFATYDKMSTMPSVHIDMMAMDPWIHLIVLITYLSRTGKKKHLSMSTRLDTLNKKSVGPMLASVGYDNDVKPAKWKNVPSLDQMIARAENFNLITTNKRQT